MSTETFRWGILGAGQIAVKFCDAVKSIADCTVAAVGSKSFSRAETFARENGISRWYGDYEELLKKERPDAVYIAATSNDHYRLTMMALDYEIPVLCEKAMFQNSGQASVVFARSEKEKVFVIPCTFWDRLWFKRSISVAWNFKRDISIHGFNGFADVSIASVIGIFRTMII